MHQNLGATYQLRKMTTLDDPHTFKLRVTKTASRMAYCPFPRPAYSIDALAQSIGAHTLIFHLQTGASDPGYEPCYWRS
jgi:hypothetical protein